MCTENTSDSANEADEAFDEASDFSDEVGGFSDTDESKAMDETPKSVTATSKPSWNRRTFLKAAALGAASVALLQKLDIALAHDISTHQCTANDIGVVGIGRIVNSCDCVSGTFTAQVEFKLTSRARARYCITIHAADGRDFLLTNNPDGTGGSTLLRADETNPQKMYARIPNFPCNEPGVVCLGGEVPRGDSCLAGTCSTISFATSDVNCATADLGENRAQCRHQQICVQGFGVTLDCNTSTSGVQDTCNVRCGTNATLEACAVGGEGPYSYTISPTTGVTGGTTKSGAGCVTFTVTPPANATTRYTVTATDSRGCARTDFVDLTATDLPAPTLSITAGPDCEGDTTLESTAVTGATKYKFLEGATVLQHTASRTLTMRFSEGQHCITVIATNDEGCESSASNEACFTVNPPVETNLVVTDNGCDGSVTFDASTSTGGGGTRTFRFTVDGTVVQNNATASYTLKPKLTSTGVLDTACRVVTVQAFDSSGRGTGGANCAGDIETRYVKQCVHTSISATAAACEAATP